MTQCYVYDNCKMIIFIESSNVKKGFFRILQILKIHGGLRKWNKKDRYHILLRDNNPLGIHKPGINIANNEVLFEKYRMDLKRDKDAIQIQRDDAIKRNRQFLISFYEC